ncbi:uncharacterized protein [Drosophila virilis]|uniref:uncharacterized protein n=1 Tax=Drosophila virilis TaxID=7244 RepID=UPI0038B302AA
MSIPFRLSALRTISGFQTVSYEAATVLAGMLPEDILAKEMEKIYMARKATGDAVSMDVIRRRNGEINFHLTQIFTGHGGYRKYLHRLSQEDSPECPNCPNLDENPERVLYQCSRYREVVGSVPPPEGVVAFMLEEEE